MSRTSLAVALAASCCAWALLAPPASAVTIGPTVPLAEHRSLTLRGDFAAAGVGLRNRGAGTIDLPVPASATILEAWLYWLVVAPEEPDGAAFLNGEPVGGTLAATAGSPCWPTLAAAAGDPPAAYAWVFRADVAGIAVAGQNTLADLPSGLDGGEDPASPDAHRSAYPLLDGAALVAVYAEPGAPLRSVIIHDGAETVFAGVATAPVVLPQPAGAVPAARAAWIVADGQALLAGDRAFLDETVVAGPGAAVRPADAFDGRDGGGPAAPHGLWDVLVADVAGIVGPGTTAVTAGIESGVQFDCLTWVAHAMSVALEQPSTTTTTSTTTSSTSSTTSTEATTSTTSTSSSSTVATTTTSTTSSTTTTISTTTTTTSTTATSSTTTTSSTAPTTSTTTTASSTSTTSTTIPGCEGAVTFASLLCRLDALMAATAAAPTQDLAFRTVSVRYLARARDRVERAAALAERGSGRAAASRLRGAARRLVHFGYRIRSLAGRRALSEDVIAQLADQAAGIAADAEILRKTLR